MKDPMSIEGEILQTRTTQTLTRDTVFANTIHGNCYPVQTAHQNEVHSNGNTQRKQFMHMFTVSQIETT